MRGAHTRFGYLSHSQRCSYVFDLAKQTRVALAVEDGAGVVGVALVRITTRYTWWTGTLKSLSQVRHTLLAAQLEQNSAIVCSLSVLNK